MIRQHGKTIIWKMVFTCSIYAMFLSENLLNGADGIWNGSYLRAGNHELSLGRWALHYIDKLHFGVSTNPFTVILSLFIFVLGTEILVNIWDEKENTKEDYFISFLFLSNVIICITLFYIFTAISYALAFFLSMLCVKCIKEGTRGKINITYLLGGAICLAFVMGLYQAYIGCILVVALGYHLLLIYRKKPVIEHVRYLGGGLFSGLIGFIIYEIILHIELARYGVQISNYFGGSDISFKSILVNLPESIVKSYLYFVKYFTGELYSWTMYQSQTIKAILILIILFLGYLFLQLWKRIRYLSILCIVEVLLIPIAVNFTLILAPQSGIMPQQMASLALVFPFFVKISFSMCRSKYRGWINKCLIVFFIVILWGNIYMVQVDQGAMREGSYAVKSIGQGVLCTLAEKGYYGEEGYVFVGAPCNSSRFYANAIYWNANAYARIAGVGSSQKGFDHKTWQGIFRNLLGVELPILDSSQYYEMEEVVNMPVYPEEGSIAVIDGIVVIKMSDIN